LAGYILHIAIHHSELLAKQWCASQGPHNSIGIILLPWRLLGEWPAATHLCLLQLMMHQ
jgi:hypothetical protein